MVSIPATSVDEYLATLPAERRAVVAAVRNVVRKRLPKGYEERPAWGMIAYEVPLSRCPETYNGKPLCFAALAAQKNHYALYLMGVYMNPVLTKRLQEGFKRAGKTLDMGKSCVRFKSLDDLALDVLGDVVAAVPIDTFIDRYQAVHPPKRAKAAKAAAKTKGTAAKSKATKATRATRRAKPT